jgi:hypothetical protein
MLLALNNITSSKGLGKKVIMACLNLLNPQLVGMTETKISGPQQTVPSPSSKLGTFQTQLT